MIFNIMKQKKTIKWLVGIIIIACCGLGVYLYLSSQYVYIDQSVIEAPIISLASSNSDVLQAIFVKDGDAVKVDEPIARVGDQIIKANVDGFIVTINKNIGQYENALSGQATVATMIDPTQLRVVGLLDEDKGLVDIKVGDVSKFTVDILGPRNIMVFR